MPSRTVSLEKAANNSTPINCNFFSRESKSQKHQASSDETSAPEEADDAKRKRPRLKSQPHQRPRHAGDRRTNPSSRRIRSQPRRLRHHRARSHRTPRLPARPLRSPNYHSHQSSPQKRFEPTTHPRPRTYYATSRRPPQRQPRHRPHHRKIRRPPPTLSPTRHPPTQWDQHPARHPQSLDPAQP